VNDTLGMVMKFLVFLTSILLTGLALGQSVDSIPLYPDQYRLAIESFKKEKVVKGKLLMLGNKNTPGESWKKLLKDTTLVDRCINGDNTFGVLNRLKEVLDHQPSELILQVGINDLSKGVPEEIVLDNIYSIVKQIKRRLPKAKIMVQSILPVNNTLPTFPKAFDKEEHTLVINRQLSKYAGHFGYEYLDVHAALINAQGLLDPKYTVDGLQLNAAGYSKWTDLIKSRK
jgi:lysophospholipase L1-like esterase